MNRFFIVLCISVVTIAFAQTPEIQQTKIYERMEQVWYPYGERYAIIVMGGDVSGQMYLWYWGDTGGMYQELLSYGFSGENIYFLSYGDSANVHSDWVDAVSTTENIIAAYQWAEDNSTANDLLYIYWVDHGSTSYFVTHDGYITHAELGVLMQPIVAKQIIGAYNPCYSGAVIDDISRVGVITVTSQDAYHPNSWGWAGYWRRALRGAPADSVDTNNDGYISMTEAYNWIAPRSQAAGEHSMFDDNGDGVGNEWGQPGYDPNDSLKDGYNGKYYSLDGWLDATSIKEEESFVDTFTVLEIIPNPFQRLTTVSFSTEQSAKSIELSIYDISGRLVRNFDYAMLSAPCTMQIIWDGTDQAHRPLPGGVYFLKLTAGNYSATRKSLLVR